MAKNAKCVTINFITRIARIAMKHIFILLSYVFNEYLKTWKLLEFLSPNHNIIV